MTKLLFACFGIAIFFTITVVTVNQYNTRNYKPEIFIEIEKNYSYEINRDKFGVPHVYGAKDKDAAFAFAFAQAEDDLEHVEMMMKMSRGELSNFTINSNSIAALYTLITGKGDILENLEAIEGVELDFLFKFFNVKETVRQKIDEIPNETIEYIKGYADGLNFYAAKNPNLVDQSLYPATVRDLVAGMTFRMPLFYGIDHSISELISLMDDEVKEVVKVKNALSNNHVVASINSYFKPSGSNTFAVAKSRSQDNETLLVINSHQPLTGPVAWYEIHLKSDEGLNIMGGTFPGSPFIHVGFNENLGWGATVNQPDLADIYKLELNPRDNNQYLLDGKWKNFKEINQKFKVKLFGPFSINYPIPMHYSKHGPVLKDNNKAYALRFVGMHDVNHSTAWLKMNKSKNLSQWLEALKMQEIASLNLVYADKEDNIYFVHNVKSPIRNSNYDWKKVLPGNDSSLIWTEFHPFENIPQILNPSSGYIFSTNQNPFFVTANEDNLMPENYNPTMGFQTRTTNRAYRAYELLDKDTSISFDEISQYKHDNKFSYNSRQYRFMSEIFNHKFFDKKLINAQEFLTEWDLGTDSNNLHAAFGVCILSPEWLAEITREPQPDPILTFTNCVDEFYKNFGTLSIKWSEVNFLERGSKLIHIQGGPDVLRAIYAPRSEDGILKAVAGDGLYIHLKWDSNKKQISKSIHQFGSATMNMNSPHYDDQINLFANEELKNTFFN
ncbi:penicillin acylase family protein [Pelagibacteraceae bacterium]|nr:penicillin acylase family protein [Pelagibacteraceae bacterium]